MHASWTVLIAGTGKIKAIYEETNRYIDEIENLCAEIARSAKARSDQQLLNAVETIQKEVAEEMKENAKTFGEFLRDVDAQQPNNDDEIEDLLNASKEVRASMTTSRDRLATLRDKLKQRAHRPT